MLGFTLSKLNLLILVTAMFAIIAFFLYGLTDIVISDLAQQHVKEYSETVFSLASGEMLCRKSTVTIPHSIEYFGGLAPSERLYYVMHLKRYPDQPGENELSTLIFQIASRKEPDRIIATSSIDVNAKIFLYEWDPENDIIAQGKALTLDPQSTGREKNSMVLVKEVYNGESFLHIIACSSSAALCETNLGRASCWLWKCHSPPRKTTCFPIPENCASKIGNC
jgi:hypothetical protein